MPEVGRFLKFSFLFCAPVQALLSRDTEMAGFCSAVFIFLQNTVGFHTKYANRCFSGSILLLSMSKDYSQVLEKQFALCMEKQFLKSSIGKGRISLLLFSL